MPTAVLVGRDAELAMLAERLAETARSWWGRGGVGDDAVLLYPVEGHRWAREWKRPQGVVWEADHQEVEVAIYVRRRRTASKESNVVEDDGDSGVRPDRPAWVYAAALMVYVAVKLTVFGLSGAAWGLYLGMVLGSVVAVAFD